jgi:hypothetical protein
MGLRFRKSIGLGSGARLNLGLRGASVTVGERDAHVTVGTRGARGVVSFPGTGVSYQTTAGRRAPRKEGSTRHLIIGMLTIYAIVCIILHAFGVI